MNAKILVIYFSHSGNTRETADQVAKMTGGDLFEVQTVKPYPKEYNAVVNVAQKEQQADARPALVTQVLNMKAYDTVIVGYPNWWGTVPMALFTFFEQYDFAGKTILPFCTHEGSGMGYSEKDIAKLCPQAKLLKGFAVRGSLVHSVQGDVQNWLRQI